MLGASRTRAPSFPRFVETSAGDDLILAVPPPMVECARCETPAVLFAASGLGLADASLPQGWLLLRGDPFCPDCASKVAPASRTPKVHAFGPEDSKSRHRGVRIAHDITLGTVGFRIHAGQERADDSRDEPVNFLLELDDLNAVITHLQVIRMELEADIQAREG